MAEVEMSLQPAEPEGGLSPVLFQSEVDQLEALRRRSALVVRGLLGVGGAALLALLYSVICGVDAAIPPAFELGDVVGTVYETAGGAFDSPFVGVFDLVHEVVSGVYIKGIGAFAFITGLALSMMSNRITPAMYGAMFGGMLLGMPIVMDTIVGEEASAAVAAQVQPPYVIAQMNVKDGKIVETKAILDEFVSENYTSVSDLNRNTVTAMEMFVYGRPMSKIAKSVVKEAEDSDEEAAESAVFGGALAMIFAAVGVGVFSFYRMLRSNMKTIEANLKILRG